LRNSIFTTAVVSLSLLLVFGIGSSAHADAREGTLSPKGQAEEDFSAPENFNPDFMTFLSESEAAEQRATLQEIQVADVREDNLAPKAGTHEITDFSSRGRYHSRGHYRHRHGGGGGGCVANQGTAVWGTFESALGSCAPGCTTGGDTCAHSHRGRSCHNSGRAVDVGSIICGGQRYGASTGRFHSFVACARKFFPSTLGAHRGRYRDNVLWQQANHYDHAHFSLGCAERGI
jgi:hypothetical protein